MSMYKKKYKVEKSGKLYVKVIFNGVLKVCLLLHPISYLGRVSDSVCVCVFPAIHAHILILRKMIGHA